MKLSYGTLCALRNLAQGETVPASKLKETVAQKLMEVGALVVIIHGSRRSYKAASLEHFRLLVENSLGIGDIEKQIGLMKEVDTSRADAVAITGDSKLRSIRTFFGFLVNSYEPIVAELNGEPYTIAPPEGSFVFISDFDSFRLPEDVVVVGIENAENFRLIRRQKAFFEKELPWARHLLFTSRYPQNGDLPRWLTTVPNRYVHFGDLDLAGIHIYLTEIYAKIGSRASFLIPSDYRNRLMLGSSERYTVQLNRYPLHSIADLMVRPLVDAIHEVHKGYDQEGFIDKL